MVCSESQARSISNLVLDESVCSTNATLDRTLSNFIPIKDHVNGDTVHLDAQEALEVDVAMLRFVERLPLDELQFVGRGSALSIFPKANDAKTSGSSLSSACCSARGVEHGHANCQLEYNGRVTREQLDRTSLELTEAPHTNSTTLGLSSMENDMDNSLAMRSPRQSKQEYTHQEHNNDTNPFGGFADSTDRDKVAHWLVHQEGMGIRAEAGIPDPQYRNVVVVPSRPQAHMDRAPSFTKRSFDSCDVFLESIGLRVAKDDHGTMSDEDFDNLPDWSDVEDDPEYNVIIKGPEYQASEYSEVEEQSYTRNPSSVEGVQDFIFPVVYLPSGFPGVAHSSQVTARTRAEQEEGS
ncbi:hypothetical protein ACET3X_003441 [Alternaria dauci]|uniref:Uncharacterized protein n=1 Tax=Alternaria dauci TaxID=48095 RepID=A0ABR3USU9_9PLEO